MSNYLSEITLPNGNEYIFKDTEARLALDNKSDVIIKMDEGSEAVKTISGAAYDLPMEITVAINPVQDKHGYEPYPAGGGKNKLPLPVADTHDGITLVQNSDGSVTLTGTATATTYFDFFDGTFNSTAYAGYKFIAYAPTGAVGSSALRFRISTSSSRTSLQEFTASETEGTIVDNGSGLSFGIRIPSGFEIPTSGYTIKAMLYASTETSEFSPYSNICPISGWDAVKITRTGQNLIPNGTDTNNGYANSQYIKESDGSGAYSSSYYSSEYFKVNGNAVYTLYDSNSTVADNPSVAFYDKDKNFISGKRIGQVAVQQITTPANAVYARCSQRNSSAGSLIQFESGSVAHAAEEYNKNDYPINLPTTAYGGTLTVHRDGSGTLVVDMAIVTIDGSESYIDVTSANVFYLTKDILSTLDVSTENDYCSMFKPVTASGSSTMVSGDVARQSTSNNRLYVKADMFAGYTASQLATYFASNNLQICLRLITPVTYNFTAQQIRSLIENNILADSGNVYSIIYYTNNNINYELASKDDGTVHGEVLPCEIAKIYDAADGMGMGFEIPISPAQDLHGYSNPWTGGAGKNLFGATISSLKELNTGGTWDGNLYTRYGVTFNFIESDGYVVRIECSGTADSSSSVVLYSNETGISANNYIFSGCPSGGSASTYRFIVKDVTATTGGNPLYEYGSGVSVENTFTIKRIVFTVFSGTDSTGKVLYPMLRLATETDATFAPYSNVCQISGYTGVDIVRTGRNMFDGLFTTEKLISDTGEETNNNDHKISTNYIPVKALAHYTISGTDIHKRPSGSSSTSNTFVNVARYRADKSFIDRAFASQSSDLSYDFETTEETAFIRFTVSVESSDVQIEVGEIASNYTPYTGCNEYNITFPTEAGTVYGGTVTINEDGSGKLVVDRVCLTFDGTESWGLYGSGTTQFARTAQDADSNRYPKFKNSGFSISSVLPLSGITTSTTTIGHYVYNSGTNDYPFIQFRDPVILNCADNTALKAYIASMYSAGTPFQACYELDSKVEYTLTQQQITSLFGLNTAWNSIGTFSKVTYYKDKPYNYELSKLEKRALPIVTSADNNKFLQVVNGEWAVTGIQAWGGGSY